MTKRAASALVEEWAHRLGLGGWEVIVRFVSRTKAPLDMAQATITGDRRVCRIDLRWPHRNNNGESDDLEQTIVHELVHCWFDPWFPTNPAKQKARVRLVENAVDAIAVALVEAKREIR